MSERIGTRNINSSHHCIFECARVTETRKVANLTIQVRRSVTFSRLCLEHDSRTADLAGSLQRVALTDSNMSHDVPQSVPKRE